MRKKRYSMKTKKLLPAVSLLLLSAVLLSTASFAWFSMNTSVRSDGFRLEAYSDSLFLEISDEKDGEYAIDVDMDYSNEIALRLVTHAHLSLGGTVIEEETAAQGERYTSESGKVYYQKVAVNSALNDTYEGDNYINLVTAGKLRDASSVTGYYNIDDGQISFSVVTDPYLVFDGTGDYYNKVGNTYYKLSLDDGDGTLDLDELSQHASLRGMYTVALGTPEDKDARYDGSSTYYAKDADSGHISPVSALQLGSHVGGYYTLSVLESGVKTASGDTKYYVENGNGDLVCLGTPAKGTDLTDYFYWARAYSSDMDMVQEDNTLNVIKGDRLSDYYLEDTLYLRIGSEDKHGEDLRISAVDVAGDDSLTGAVRVYFEAVNGAGQISRATYNNRTGKIEHLDGGVLFSNILSNRAEVIEVKVYIYYEGTDRSAKTKDVKLSGQSVSVEFEVDFPDYAS